MRFLDTVTPTGYVQKEEGFPTTHLYDGSPWLGPSTCFGRCPRLVRVTGFIEDRKTT